MNAQPGSATRENGDPASTAAPSHVLHPAERRVLTFPLLSSLGVRHGFTMRGGGVSAGRYATLNLGDKWGDDPTHVAENLRRVSTDCGFAAADLCQVNQVHGIDVVTVHAVEKRDRAADGMVTQERLPLAVYSADCVSILMSDGEGRVAAVHAGWRGTVGGIAGQAVQALAQLGARPKRLHAVLAPSIGPCCFQVQEDVASRFRAALPSSVRNTAAGGLFVDLWHTNRWYLQQAGVPAEQIDAAPRCTHCDPEHFFSYRRDGAGIGQHMAFIVGGGP